MFVAATTLAACVVQYSFEQEKVETSTLGQELWTIWHRDAQRAVERPEQKTQMLVEQHNAFVDAVDAVAPPAELTAVNGFITNVLTLIDEGIVPALTRKVIVILREAAADVALLAGLATPAGPEAESLVSDIVAPNLLGYITGHPDLVSLLRFTTRVALSNDGFTDAGNRTFDEPAGVSDILRVLVRELRETPTASDDEPLAVTVRDLLLVEDSAYVSDVTQPSYVALFDRRGFPLAATDLNGQVVYPFTDADGDGLADVDAMGEFVLQGGMSVALRPFAPASQSTIAEPVTRDAYGRAIGPSGPVFQYIDIERTALGFIVRQQHRLSGQDALYDLLQAFRLIMGSKQVHTDEIGGYEGYTADQPLMEMSHALVLMLDNPGTADLLDGMGELAARSPQALANLFWALDNMVDILNASSEYAMSDLETMAYDVLPLIAEIAADQELWKDVLHAMAHPVARRNGQAFATMLQYRDSNTVPVKDGPYDRCFQQCNSQFTLGTPSRFDCIRGCPMGEIFSEEVDYALPESPTNNSSFQKMQHLLRDTQGQPYSMTIERAAVNGRPLPDVPPLLHLEAAAEAFMAAVAGNLHLADKVPPQLWQSSFGELLDLLGVENGNVAALISTLSALFGAHLDVVPTPDQITRLFNQPDIKFETTEGSNDVLLDPADPTCRDGYVMSQHYAYVLYQAEASGAVDALYPIAKAFSDHGREDLLLKLLNVLHDHYAHDASPYKTAAGAQSPMKAANLRSYEPAMRELFTNGRLFEALNDYMIAQQQMESATGIPLTEAMRQLVLMALQPANNYKGESYVNINDGRTIGNATALHHLFRAMDEAATRMKAEPAVQAGFDSSVGAYMKIVAGTTKLPGGEPQFADAGSVKFAAHASSYLADEFRARQQSGELSTWLHDDVLPSLEELWSGRMLAAFIDIADSALADDADKAVLDNFLTYLFGSPQGRTQVLIATHQLLVQSIARDRWQPTAQFLATVLDPDREWATEPFGRVPVVSLVMQMLKGSLDLDPDNTGIFMIHRGLNRPQFQDAPFTTIVDVIARYFSLNPADDTFRTSEDYRHFFVTMANYLEDDVHGLERLYELVDKRVKPATADFN